MVSVYVGEQIKFLVWLLNEWLFVVEVVDVLVVIVFVLVVYLYVGDGGCVCVVGVYWIVFGGIEAYVEGDCCIVWVMEFDVKVGIEMLYWGNFVVVFCQLFGVFVIGIYDFLVFFLFVCMYCVGVILCYEFFDCEVVVEVQFVYLVVDELLDFFDCYDFFESEFCYCSFFFRLKMYQRQGVFGLRVLVLF